MISAPLLKSRITCVSTHLDDTFWTPNDFFWDIDQWRSSDPNGSDGGVPVVLGPPIGGWNTPGFRPDRMNISIGILSQGVGATELNYDIFLDDTNSTQIGSTTLFKSRTILETTGASASMTLDFSGSGGFGIGNITITPDVYSGKIINFCIQFI